MSMKVAAMVMDLWRATSLDLRGKPAVAMLMQKMKKHKSSIHFFEWLKMLNETKNIHMKGQRWKQE